jgi:hypothetical protein
MELDRSAARDYVIRREGEALLAADLNEELQINPECAHDVLLVEPEPSASEFNDIHLDRYTADCAADVRDQLAQ